MPVNNIAFTAGVIYVAGVPTVDPGATGSRLAINTLTDDHYEYTGGAWALIATAGTPQHTSSHVSRKGLSCFVSFE